MRISDGSSDVCSSDLGQRVEKLERLADGHADGRRFRLTTSKGTVIEAGAVIIAAGAGAFGPNRPPLDGITAYEGRPEGSGVQYLVRRTEAYRGKSVVIAGGGDSAVDWARAPPGIASQRFFVPRRAQCRAPPSNGGNGHR